MWTLLVAAALAAPTAEPEPAESAAMGALAAPPPFDPRRAEPMPALSEADWRFLEPKRERLPGHPRAQTDFTAYTLEWGEVKVGLASVTVGALPRLQLGTVPVLDALGVYNANAKWNVVRAGPIDVAALGAYTALPLGEFLGTWTSGGAMASLVIARPWSVHVGGTYAAIDANGAPDPNALSPLVLELTGLDPDRLAYDPEAVFGTADPRVSAGVATWRVATDVRFNRRDSLVLQAQGIAWARVEHDLDADVPSLFGLDRVLAQDGPVAVRDAYTVTLSYQASFKAFDLRVGGGASAVPLAWVLQATDASVRFGGETRREEARMRRAWKKDRDVIGRRPVRSADLARLPDDGVSVN